MQCNREIPITERGETAEEEKKGSRLVCILLLSDIPKAKRPKRQLFRFLPEFLSFSLWGIVRIVLLARQVAWSVRWLLFV